MTLPACQACGGGVCETEAGLRQCAACGLAYRVQKVFHAPAYAPAREELVYNSSKKKIFKAALDLLGAAAGRPGRLLDIGCAGGEFLTAAASRGWSAEGVEIEPGLAARAAGAGFKVQTSPVEAAGLPAAAFDAVTAFEVFSQMDAPAAAAAEAARLLKPGGLLYLREFNAAFHVTLYRLELRGFFRFLGARPSVIHNFNFTPGSLRALLGRAGFTDVSVRNSRPTSGDPYGSGGGLGTFFTAALKVLYYLLAQAVWLATLGRVYAGSALIVTARKPR
ncbi:MAG: class I SAM-dependent methyltransferase [Elusimicrobiales bacterium]|nr:class I SAM-dependent methyltransferase [Elusimicrobiales bacterium]